MTPPTPCFKCGNAQIQWGKDPMNLICNDCFQSVSFPTSIYVVSTQQLCSNCLYWITADKAFGRCRNSHSTLFNTFTPLAESCSSFLAVD